MIAVHLESGAVSVRNKAQPEPPAGHALIRILLAGICNTDLELQRGYYGFSGTPGHEFVGEVVKVANPELVGKRVVGEINLACGHCDYCAVGLGRHCPTRTVLGIVQHPGAFAEYITLPESNLHLVPEGISEEQAVFIEPLAAACEILDQVHIPQGEPVAVLGDGKLGLLIAQVLHAHGARVMLYGRHPVKLRLTSLWGIETAAQNSALFRYQFVVEASGSPTGLKEAVNMVRPRGTIILKSTIHGEVALDTAPIIVNEITLVGSRCGRFEAALALLENHSIDLSSLVSNEFPLQHAPEAFQEAAKRSVLKVLLRPQAR